MDKADVEKKEELQEIDSDVSMTDEEVELGASDDDVYSEGVE